MSVLTLIARHNHINQFLPQDRLYISAHRHLILTPHARSFNIITLPNRALCPTCTARYLLISKIPKSPNTKPYLCPNCFKPSPLIPITSPPKLPLTPLIPIPLTPPFPPHRILIPTLNYYLQLYRMHSI